MAPSKDAASQVRRYLGLSNLCYLGRKGGTIMGRDIARWMKHGHNA
jgi:hypothetical protein